MSYQVNLEKNNKTLESTVSDLQGKLDEANRQMSDLGNVNSRNQRENTEFQKTLEDAESQINQLTRAKQQLQTQLDEAKQNLEDESRVRFLKIELNIIRDIIG